MYIYVYPHAHAHTHTLARTCARSHTHTLTLSLSHTNTHTRAYFPAWTCVPSWNFLDKIESTIVQTWSSFRLIRLFWRCWHCVYIRSYVHTQSHTHTHAHAHTQTLSLTHTHAHTNTHTHTHAPTRNMSWQDDLNTTRTHALSSIGWRRPRGCLQL